MASIGDIANQAKALLEKIDANTLATKSNTASVDNHVVQLINTNHTGFANLSQGLALQMIIQKQTNQLLDLNAKQNETIICWLRNIGEELCSIVHNTTNEVMLQKQMTSTLLHLDKIIELVYSREAMEVLKINELNDRMEKCCPTKEIPQEPCFKECIVPEHPKMDPIKSDWKPLKQNDVKVK